MSASCYARVMGSELAVHGNVPSIQAVLDRLAERGMVAQVLMVDGALQMPGVEPAAGWREIRLRTPAGMVTLRRTGDGVGVVVFGNADAALVAAQREIGAAMTELGAGG